MNVVKQIGSGQWIVQELLDLMQDGHLILGKRIATVATRAEAKRIARDLCGPSLTRLWRWYRDIDPPTDAERMGW